MHPPWQLPTASVYETSFSLLVNKNKTYTLVEFTSNFLPRRIPPMPSGSQKFALLNLTTMSPMCRGESPAAKSPAVNAPALAPVAKLTCRCRSRLVGECGWRRDDHRSRMKGLHKGMLLAHMEPS